MTAWAKTTATGDAEKGVPKRESTGAAAAASSSTSAPSSVDFYSQKNCAAQYNLLLKLVEPATPHGRRTKRYSVQWQCYGPRKLFYVIYNMTHPLANARFCSGLLTIIDLVDYLNPRS